MILYIHYCYYLSFYYYYYHSFNISLLHQIFLSVWLYDPKSKGSSKDQLYNQLLQGCYYSQPFRTIHILMFSLSTNESI